MVVTLDDSGKKTFLKNGENEKDNEKPKGEREER